MRPLSERPYAQHFDPKEDMTKQSFKDECDINKIMAKFQKTGALTHYASHAPEYGDHSRVELQDALNVVADATTMFEELPSKIRDKFSNDPGLFLDFVQDEKNLAEMRELGLANPAPITVESKPERSDQKPDSGTVKPEPKPSEA